MKCRFIPGTIFFAMLSIAFTGKAWADHYKDGVGHYQAGRYQAAFEAFTKAAEAGDRDAQESLGFFTAQVLLSRKMKLNPHTGIERQQSKDWLVHSITWEFSTVRE